MKQLIALFTLASLMLSAPLLADEAKTAEAKADVKKAAVSTQDAVVTTFEETKAAVGAKVEAGTTAVKDKFQEVKTNVQDATKSGVAKTQKTAKKVGQTIKDGVVTATDAVLGTGAETGPEEKKVEEKK